MIADSPLARTEPPHDCPRCPRLVAFRHALRIEYPDWWNAPVPALGDPDAWLAIVGLAPGKHGANRTGRPFTGDHAGVLLFETLGAFGLATGRYDARPDDGLRLTGAAIINAVKCLPPENKPMPEEIATCRPFLAAQLAVLEKVRVIVPLGQIAHQSTLRLLGERVSAFRFGHGAEHRLSDGRVMIDSYHCSRYNQNTGRLTPEMFRAVFARALEMRQS
ncbi:uracil-DNA glycosylase family 4 [Sphingomonas jejuensis]|uniref:Type-5 uracil-DNA glycosylase n=1 Tax=Sphingomonas jejuensis TaxID=904715 RepID=A0ABX0XM64_9SPHN|nr:uracil-DNA glycosylase [Sphingomonas jejuensis]NJC33771.1 uracil-DNA glycosylase family 4 [Sphingomonas jejuensis]